MLNQAIKESFKEVIKLTAQNSGIATPGLARALAWATGILSPGKRNFE